LVLEKNYPPRAGGSRWVSRLDERERLTGRSGALVVSGRRVPQDRIPSANHAVPSMLGGQVWPLVPVAEVELAGVRPRAQASSSQVVVFLLSTCLLDEIVGYTHSLLNPAVNPAARGRLIAAPPLY